MLEELYLSNVGPAATMNLDFGERLNLITGDNGLGKSFLLDVAWWSLTRTWARRMVIPSPGTEAKISFAYTKKTPGSYEFTSKYEPSRVRWTVKASRPPIPGLILYAQVDGGFSVWDPMRNYWTEDAPDRPNAFLFTPEEVWTGNEHCRGVLEDWLLWQTGNDRRFGMLREVLRGLSPSATDAIEPGKPREITINDKGETPTLKMPYGEEVPLSYVSAGMRRIIALGYLLTWAWDRHVQAAKLRNEEPSHEVVLLVDELEAHLHPQWQRRIVPALLGVMDALTGQHKTSVQLIAATHSPLVLASAEPLFDEGKDAWFDLDLEKGKVVLRERDFVRLGEVSNWLTSEAFDLGAARSLEAEQAIEATRKLFQGTPTAHEIKRVHKLLQASLGETDRFWMRWSQYLESMKGKGARS